MRRLYTSFGDIVGIGAGWAWLGNAGAGLLALWILAVQQDVWDRRPRQLRVDLARLRSVRLGRWRVVCTERWWRGIEVFADELPPADYARLRRELKWHFEGGLPC